MMLANNGQVKIGREFFEKIKLDYADWHWALIREFLQNGIDAPGCGEIAVTVQLSADRKNTLLTVRNDGAPMTQDILVNKLLTLGGSGKNFEGENTGGFGVAKSLLYYTHLDYTILTGDHQVSGTGAQYAITEVGNHFYGTESTVRIEGDQVKALLDAVRRFAAFAQWRGSLMVNGTGLECDLRKGARRRDLGWAVVYSNQSFSNLCVVRLNGQPMFTRYCRYKGCVLVELNGKAFETLTSNRDDLKRPMANELNDLLTALAVDKRSALREQRAQYKRYVGEKLKAEARQPKKAKETLGDLVDVAALAASVVAGPQGETAPPTVTSGGGIRVRVESAEDEATVSIGPEFIIKNTTGMVTPGYYSPGEGFSKYSKELIRVWVAILLKIYQIHGVGGEFSVGFVLDEDSIAEFERGIYGPVYYVNPARVVCQREKPQCRSFRTRYVGAWADRFDLIASAAHEFVHGALGLKEHDEDFAGSLTDVMATVFAHLGEITPLCRA